MGTPFWWPEGSHQYGTMWADAFPDGSVTVDRVMSAGESVVVKFTGRGTHAGDLVTSQHAYMDSGCFTAQLGLTGQGTTTQRMAGEQ